MSTLALGSDALAGTPTSGAIEYNGQFYATDSNASRAQMQRINLSTAVASTSGTSIDFTGIPSWVKRITVMFNGTSVSGTSPIQVQLGTAGGIENTGYVGSVVQHASSANNTTGFSAGFQIAQTGLAAGTEQGFMTLVTLGSNIWAAGGTIALNGQAVNSLAGNKTTSGTLDRVRITTVNGTDTFDAGSINILYEG